MVEDSHNWRDPYEGSYPIYHPEWCMRNRYSMVSSLLQSELHGELLIVGHPRKGLNIFSCREG